MGHRLGPAFMKFVAYARDDDGNIAFSENIEQVVVFAESSEVLGFTSFEPLAFRSGTGEDRDHQKSGGTLWILDDQQSARRR